MITVEEYIRERKKLYEIAVKDEEKYIDVLTDDIVSISIAVNELSEIIISYFIEKNPMGTQYTKKFLERELFESKEELLKSL